MSERGTVEAESAVKLAESEVFFRVFPQNHENLRMMKLGGTLKTAHTNIKMVLEYVRCSHVQLKFSQFELGRVGFEFMRFHRMDARYVRNRRSF